MRDKMMARFCLAGASLSGAVFTAGKKLGFAESRDIKNSLAVKDGEITVGYVIGSEAALIKAFLARGMNMYCLYAGKTEGEENDRHMIEVYYIPKRI